MSDLAPNYIIKVADKELKTNVTQFIESVEYESSDGIIDMGRVTAMNPNFLLSDSKVFAPGNEMEIYMGYGSSRVKLIGRVILMTPRIVFPEDGMPIIAVTGYTKDYLMREQRPDPTNKEKKAELENLASQSTPMTVRYKAALHRLLNRIVWDDEIIKNIIEEKAKGYQCVPDVDYTPEIEGSFIQPANMSDYDFLLGLSNLTGYLFWVDYSLDKGWELHFRDPLKDLGMQEKEYTFKYNFGNLSTLLSFEPELIFRDHYTSIKARMTDTSPGPRFGKVIETEIVEKADQKIEPTFLGVVESLGGTFASAEAIKLFIGDYSFTAKTNMLFRTEEALKKYATNWFRRMREHFIVGRGRIIGLETLTARQVHRLEGLGYPYDGKYYFSRVRHVMDRGQGYYCEFNARKVLEESF